MLKCFDCGYEYFDDDLILVNQEHKCYSCTNNLRNLEINKLYNMDCQEGLKLIKTESIDLIVTDPPYGIYFMNKEWDIQVPSIEICRQMCRVLKNGAFAFVMMSPRQDVLHKMIFNLRQAGFETNFTSIYWTYSSGFPKAMNISKKVDDFLGVERDYIPTTGNLHKGSGNSVSFIGTQKDDIPRTQKDDIPRTQKAQELDGSYGGFQPKPAVEIIIVAMKRLNQENYVQQAIHNQKGITWLDDCRIPFESHERIESEACPSLRQSEAEEKSIFGINANKTKSKDYQEGKLTFKGDGTGQNYFAQYLIDKRGRFPSNLLVSDDILNNGIITKGEIGRTNRTPTNKSFGLFNLPAQVTDFGSRDVGLFSRYFSLDNWWKEKIKKLPDEIKKVFPFLIVPKPSNSERNKNLEQFETKPTGSQTSGFVDGKITLSRNTHPTCKPLDLMCYLVILGSRENDIVLDCFMGSGTTAIACRLLNRNFIGFEINKEYHKIAEARLSEYQKQKKLFEVI